MQLLSAIDRPYATIDVALGGLTRLEAQFLVRRDWRGVFASAYVVIVTAIRHQLERDRFSNPAWVERYLLAATNQYRQALAAYEGRTLEAVGEPWRIAFDFAREGSMLVVQDLLIGLSAHLHYDLPQALASVGLEPNRPRCQADHTIVVETIWEATSPIRRRVNRLYAPAMQAFPYLPDASDQIIANFNFARARRSAWCWGELLFDAGTPEQTESTRRNMEIHAARQVKMIAGPSQVSPELNSALYRYEEGLVDWRGLVPLQGC